MSEGTIRCPACGAELPENFKFCAECGHKLTTAARAPEARAPEVRASAVRVSAAPPVEAAPDERRDVTVLFADVSRSEERRGGKECVSTCRTGWSPDH